MATINNPQELLQQLMDNNDIWSANLLLKNQFNRQIEDQAVFEEFFAFSMRVAKWNIDLSSRKHFLEQGKSALLLFSENGEITEDTISLIQAKQVEIQQIQHEIDALEMQLRSKQETAVKEENVTLLTKLVDVKLDLQNVTEKSLFHDLLHDIKQTEEQINTSLLDDQQKQLLDDLTNEYSELINNKLSEFERRELTDYNKEAVANFKQAFDQFKANEDKYKTNLVDLKRLARNHLFSFETDQLFNETLIYYNHVYSYIFGKLDDDGKFRLTELAVATEKTKRR